MSVSGPNNNALSSSTSFTTTVTPSFSIRPSLAGYQPPEAIQPIAIKAPLLSFHDAIREGDFEALENYVANPNIDINQPEEDLDRRPPLILAVAHGYTEAVTLFLNHHADVDATDA